MKMGRGHDSNTFSPLHVDEGSIVQGAWLGSALEYGDRRGDQHQDWHQDWQDAA